MLEALFALDTSRDVIDRRLLRLGLFFTILYTVFIWWVGLPNTALDAWIGFFYPYADVIAQHLGYVSFVLEKLESEGEAQRAALAAHLFMMNLSIMLATLFGMYLFSLARLGSRPLTLLRRKTEMTKKLTAVRAYVTVLLLVALLPYLPGMILANPQQGFAFRMANMVLASDATVSVWTLVASMAFAILVFHLFRTLVWFLLWVVSQCADRTFAVLWR